MLMPLFSATYRQATSQIGTIHRLQHHELARITDRPTAWHVQTSDRFRPRKSTDSDLGGEKEKDR